MGGPVDSWATAATRWGSIEPKDGSGREYLQGQKMDADATHIVRLRYYSGLTVRHRLQNTRALTTRTFNIVQVINADELKREHLLLCKEVL